MIIRKPFLQAGVVFVGMTFATGLAPSLRAQTAAVSPAPATAPETFDSVLGTQTVNGATYSVTATQPLNSILKGQRIRFTAVTPTSAGTTTRYFTVNTGKFRTVAQLAAYLRETFAKFVAGAPANTEVGKVGDIKYGGEIHFVVESSDMLLYNTMTTGEPNASMNIPKAEAAAYVAILPAGAPPKR